MTNIAPEQIAARRRRRKKYRTIFLPAAVREGIMISFHSEFAPLGV